MILKYSIVLSSLYTLSFILGLFVKHKNLRVNYSRKILAFLFFISGYLVLVYFPTDNDNVINTILGLLVPLFWLLSFQNFFTKKSKFLKTCFLSFDRPEDRPYTLLWFITSMIAGYLVMFSMIAWLELYQAEHLFAIAVFVSTFGDGLAEPVGVKYGKHKYKTRALFTNRIYHRTLEGSACVFFSALASIISIGNGLPTSQYVFLLLVMPLAMAVTEAKSPHTWDNPFLLLVGGIVAVASLHIHYIF